MAKDKNSVIIYADWIDKFEELTDDEAGKLIKHFFRYVNDLNPQLEDRILKMAFHDIEKSLKRDLKKWENTKGERSDSGILGNLKRWHEDLFNQYSDGKITLEKALSIAENRKKSHSDNSDSKKSQTSLLTVSVSVTVNDIPLIKKVSEFENDILEFFGFSATPKNINNQRLISDFCYIKNISKELNYFAQQFYDYKIYLEISNKLQFRLSLFNYLGKQEDQFKNGKWNNENWSLKLKEFLGSLKTNLVKGATDQSQNVNLLK